MHYKNHSDKDAYLKNGFSAPFTMQVVLVRAEAKLLAISESGNIFLKRGLKVSTAASGMLWSTKVAANWTSADVTWKLKRRDDSNLGGSRRLRTLENISIVFFIDKNKDVSAITFIIATTHSLSCILLMYKPCLHYSVLERMLGKALSGSCFPWRFSYARLVGYASLHHQFPVSRSR